MPEKNALTSQLRADRTKPAPAPRAAAPAPARRDEYVAPARTRARSGFFDFIPAVREGRQQSFENDLAQRQLEVQERGQFNEDRINRSQEGRTQQEFDTERATQTTLGALGAFSNMVDSIGSSEIPEAERPQAYTAAFDRIAPALQASGHDPRVVDQMREQLIANPTSAADILAGLQGVQGGGGSQPSLQAAFDANGRPVFVNPRTGREAAIGYAPASTVLGNSRIGVSQQNANIAQGNLDQRTLTNTPEYREQRTFSETEGRGRAEASAALPALRNSTRTALANIDTFLANPDRGSIYGLPNLRSLETGGFGMAGVVPGSRAGVTLTQYNAAVGALKGVAISMLEGQTPVSNQDREAAEQSIAALERATSPREGVRQMQILRAFVVRNLAAAEERSAGSSGSAPSARPRPRHSADSVLERLGG